MKAPQLVPGDILKLPDGTSEVVRAVFVVVQMANGMDRRYAPVDDVMIVDQAERPPAFPARVVGQPSVEPPSEPPPEPVVAPRPTQEPPLPDRPDPGLPEKKGTPPPPPVKRAHKTSESTKKEQ